MKNRTGKIGISALNTLPEKHEYETAKYFSKRGYDIFFIPPRNIKGMNNPDFRMDGRVWEVKSPLGSSKRVFENNFRKAIKQSENIIIDLRRMKRVDEKWCLDKINQQIKTRKIKTLLVITREGKLLTLKGRFDIIWT